MFHSNTVVRGVILASVTGLAATGIVQAQEVPKVAQPKASEVLHVFLERDNAIHVWKDGQMMPAEAIEIPGKFIQIKQIVPCPDGHGLIILVSERLMWCDGSYAIVFFDPQTGVQKRLYDSYQDRWGEKHFMQEALTRDGRDMKGMPDDDLTKVFYDNQGRLYFTTEDSINYRLTSDGKEIRLDVATEVAVAPTTRVPEKKIDGKDGFLVDYAVR